MSAAGMMNTQAEILTIEKANMTTYAHLQKVPRRTAPHRFPWSIKCPWNEEISASHRGPKIDMQRMVMIMLGEISNDSRIISMNTMDIIPPIASPSAQPLVV